METIYKTEGNKHISLLEEGFTPVEEATPKISIQELKEMCKPVAEYLKKNWDPQCTVVITDSHIKLVRDEIGIPVLEKGTAQEVLVQEQYECKCKNCGRDNQINLSNHIKPNFCMECGAQIEYVKKVH